MRGLCAVPFLQLQTSLVYSPIVEENLTPVATPFSNFLFVLFSCFFFFLLYLSITIYHNFPTIIRRRKQIPCQKLIPIPFQRSHEHILLLPHVHGHIDFFVMTSSSKLGRCGDRMDGPARNTRTAFLLINYN